MISREHPARGWRGADAGRCAKGLWIRRLTLVAAFALLCAVVAAAAWLARATPVEDRAGSVWSERGSGPAPVVHESISWEHDVAYASLAERGRFTAGLDVGNTGRFDVRIIGLDDVDGPAGLTPELWMGENFVVPYEGEGSTRLVPFEPFTLRPGEIRYLAVGVRLPGDAACADGPARFRGSIGTMPLRFEVLGVIRRTAEIELRRALGVVCGERPAPWPPRP